MSTLDIPGDRVDRFELADPSWVRPRVRGFLLRRLDEYWPLTLYFYLYPLWWVIGLSKLILFFFIFPMLWQLMRHRDVRTPRGFGIFLVFLVWVSLGVFMLWVRAPGTEPKQGLAPLIGFGFRAMWYASVTIACLYVLNAVRTRLTAVRVTRMLAFLFVVTAIGGVVGLLAPSLDFPSLVELFLPKRATRAEFFNALFHPRIALQSEFLGYSQPRITAPFAYPNTWGNAFGLLIPFFIYAWFGPDAGWRRYVAPFILIAAIPPVVYSLNRGLWLGLGVSLLWVVLRRLMAGDFRAVIVSLCAAAALVVALVATPLGTMIALRVSTPHSDDRRQDTASEVLRTTWEASPILGYGGTRQMTGNFNSIVGGVPGCHQCSAPPLGTQGFLWGLVFMTGFVGAILMVSFLFWQFQLNARRSTPLGLLASTVILASGFYFLFYDSLDVPMLVTMMTIGLATREHTRPNPLQELIS
ncbi:MAG: hypothetical protein WAW88_16880 [Nocardioides sp.]